MPNNIASHYSSGQDIHFLQLHVGYDTFITNVWFQKISIPPTPTGLGGLWMKAHYGDIGIINIIRQRLKDIELQRWLSEINNDTRKDANQGNKMRTYRLFKTTDNYKCEDYLHQVTNT